MALHISFDDQLPHGRQLRSALSKIEDGAEGIKDTLASMSLMLDGDGSQAAHFPVVTAKFGFDSDAKAKEGYDEINSLKLALDGVLAAITQAANKLR